MRFYLTIIGFFLSVLAFAQEIASDTIPKEDTTEVKKPIKLPPVGIYAEGQFIFAPTPEGYFSSRQLGGGISYKRISAGVFYNVFDRPYTEIVVFPNQFDLLYAHGGGYVGLMLLDSRFLEGEVRLNYSRGDMIWEYRATREDFLRDEFEVFKPEIQIRFVPFKFVKLFTAVGYNAFRNLELPSAPSNEFSGLTLGFGLQIGLIE